MIFNIRKLIPKKRQMILYFEASHPLQDKVSLPNKNKKTESLATMIPFFLIRHTQFFSNNFYFNLFDFLR